MACLLRSILYIEIAVVTHLDAQAILSNHAFLFRMSLFHVYVPFAPPSLFLLLSRFIVFPKLGC